MPKLSICVPSRNRQVYFQQTILDLIENTRSDVEFVFADNSDDPAIMNDFMAKFAGDSRIKFIPSEDRIYSMVDNWERAISATTGDWVTVIGDDDYVAPDLATVLLKLELIIPDAEAFDWLSPHFTWPAGHKPEVTNSHVQLHPEFYDIPKSWLILRGYQWVGATHAPTHGFSIYHAALSRRLVERIRARFSGRYFQHPTVDLDSSLKAILLGNRFIFWQRPLSILGACPLSTSAIAFKPRKISKHNATFMAEVGYDINEHPGMKDLPFNANMGTPASILVTQQFIKTELDFDIDGWQENFAKACANYCAKMRTQDDFDYITAQYRESFRRWDNGRYAHAFNPVFAGQPENYEAFSGVLNGVLHVNGLLSEAKTPKEIYDFLSSFLPPLDDTQINPASLKKPPALNGKDNSQTSLSASESSPSSNFLTAPPTPAKLPGVTSP